MRLEVGVPFIITILYEIMRIPNVMSKSKRADLARLSYKTWNTPGLHS